MNPRRLFSMGLAVLLAGISAVAVVPARAEDPFCFECHDDFPEKMKSFTYTHEPAAGGECTACHQDHKDEERLMLVREGAALCSECHDAMDAGASVHPPVADGECTSCHNPHGSPNPKMLLAAGAKLCSECHDAMDAGASVHPPVADGECTGCHNPHSSPNPKMLVAAGAKLCSECHDAMDAGTSVHAPVAAGECTSCHNPHSSQSQKLLVAAGQALCDTCHAANQDFKGRVVHAALDEGCSSCHRPHASEHKRLLAKNLVLDRMALYDPKQAELCFDCHSEEAFLEERTEDTGFRMGTRNLHALHLNGGATKNKYGMIKKKDGQTCFACHLPHTAIQEKLVRTEYQCEGTFCYTMRYVQNTSGGTCIVGCHKPKTYSRVGVSPDATAGALPGDSKAVR